MPEANSQPNRGVWVPPVSCRRCRTLLTLMVQVELCLLTTGELVGHVDVLQQLPHYSCSAVALEPVELLQIPVNNACGGSSRLRQHAAGGSFEGRRVTPPATAGDTWITIVGLTGVWIQMQATLDVSDKHKLWRQHRLVELFS